MHSLYLYNKDGDDMESLFKKLNEKSVLFIAKNINDNTFLAFRNLKDCYVVEENEVNAYLIAVFRAVVCEKVVFDNLINDVRG